MKAHIFTSPEPLPPHVERLTAVCGVDVVYPMAVWDAETGEFAPNASRLCSACARAVTIISRYTYAVVDGQTGMVN